MDWDLIINFIFVLLAASLTFSTVLRFQRKSVEHKERKLELEARIAEAKKGERTLGNEVVQQIEDRLRVIERIVTDPGADLSRQIEDLRAEASARREKVQ
ncbi:hypothetical protein [Aurantiacibacter gilvus]|uniref:Uncharacterized protein n=1 Tax=Aurantiacibacter gilvus TaxID=3139141 RepID=A0ABU9IBJ8_9SPHN